MISYLKDLRRLHSTLEIRKRISLSTVSYRQYRQIPILLRFCVLQELWKPQTSLRFHKQDSNENPISEFPVLEPRREIHWTTHVGSITFAICREGLDIPVDHEFDP